MGSDLESDVELLVLVTTMDQRQAQCFKRASTRKGGLQLRYLHRVVRILATSVWSEHTLRSCSRPAIWEENKGSVRNEHGTVLVQGQGRNVDHLSFAGPSWPRHEISEATCSIGLPHGTISCLVRGNERCCYEMATSYPAKWFGGAHFLKRAKEKRSRLPRLYRFVPAHLQTNTFDWSV